MKLTLLREPHTDHIYIFQAKDIIENRRHLRRAKQESPPMRTARVGTFRVEENALAKVKSMLNPTSKPIEGRESINELGGFWYRINPIALQNIITYIRTNLEL